jgi:TolA-binding protein
MKQIIIALLSVLVLGACTSSDTETKEVIIKKDSVIVNAMDCPSLLIKAKRLDSLLLASEVLNPKLAVEAIVVFTDVATHCGNDSLAPEFLLKGGQVAQAIKNYTKAEELFKKCAAAFPKYKNRGAALFLLARLYDEASMLNNEVAAKLIYSQIIMEYPTSSYATDAKACLQNIGKTDEQIVQEFLKKSK